jgi:predicted HicB family RNase H-like nuclease
MEPSMLKLAAQVAKANGQTVGKWLEEAIREKIKREGSDE